MKAPGSFSNILWGLEANNTEVILPVVETHKGVNFCRPRFLYKLGVRRLRWEDHEFETPISRNQIN